MDSPNLTATDKLNSSSAHSIPMIRKMTQDDCPSPADRKYLAPKKTFIARLFVFGLFIFGLMLAKAYGSPTASYDCLHDNLMDFLQPVNDFINDNPFWRDFFQGISSGLLDLTFLITFVPWVIKGTTGRPVYCMAIFYLIRGLVQQVIIMGFPSGYWWYSPGFPSLVVPYGRDSDFFFSGHVGFLMICSCENWVVGRRWLFWCGMVMEIYLIFVLVSYRVHYSTDIIAGLFISHWVFMVMCKHSPSIDKFFFAGYKKAHDIIDTSKSTEETNDIKKEMLI